MTGGTNPSESPHLTSENMAEKLLARPGWPNTARGPPPCKSAAEEPASPPAIVEVESAARVDPPEAGGDVDDMRAAATDAGTAAAPI